jgi:hypothetical protein
MRRNPLSRFVSTYVAVIGIGGGHIAVFITGHFGLIGQKGADKIVDIGDKLRDRRRRRNAPSH